MTNLMTLMLRSAVWLSFWEYDFGDFGDFGDVRMLVSSFPSNGLSNDKWQSGAAKCGSPGDALLARGYAAHAIRAVSDLIVFLRRPSFFFPSMAPKFLCCLPLRFGTFVITLVQLLVCGLAASGFWYLIWWTRDEGVCKFTCDLLKGSLLSTELPPS